MPIQADKPLLKNENRVHPKTMFTGCLSRPKLSKAAMTHICEYLDTMCSSFVLNVATSETHRLKHHLPVHQSDIGRHSRRLEDVPKTLSNYNTTKKSIFNHYTVPYRPGFARPVGRVAG